MPERNGWPANNRRARSPDDIVRDGGNVMKDKEFVTCLVAIFILAFAIFVCLAYLL